MSAKTWIKDSGGMYTETPTRGARAGETVYKARVWIKSRQDFAYFYLGVTERQAGKRMREILGNPEAALAQRDARPAPAAPTFEAMVKKFLATYRARGGTSDYYKSPSASWIGHFGKTIGADKITRAMVEDYRDSLRRAEYGDSTIRKYVGNLSTLYKWARGRGLVADDPVLAWSRNGEGVPRPSEPDREVDVVTRDEQTKAEQKADPLTRNVIALFCESGMRAGGRGDGEEGIRLKWSQVDRQNGHILVPKSKTGKARSIPLNARLTAVLGRVTRHVRSEYVLCDHEGKQLDYFTINRLLESAFEAAGVEKQGGVFNMMRHTFGSRLAEQGVPTEVIAEIMGNSPEVCRRHYIRFSPGHLKAAMARLDTVTAPPTAPPSGEAGIPGAAGQSEAVAS